MKRSCVFASALFCTILPLSAGDSEKLTIQLENFVIRESFTATALPSAVEPIAIDAKFWTEFEIIHLTAHGSSVKKGDMLIAFEPEALLRSIEDKKAMIEQRDHELAAARRELDELRESAEERLKKSRATADQATEDYQYQLETWQAVEIESSRQSIRNAESRLRNAKEELVQLERMYAADDLVEETEEIILTRAREAVEAAEFSLRYQTLEQTRRIEVVLPRQLETLLHAKMETARKRTTDEAEIPRGIALKEQALKHLEVAQARDKETLARLEADRTWLEITAPADGTFYHGVIEHGEWSTPADVMRTLVVGARLPLKRPVASFIPANAKLDLHATLPEATARSLGAGKPTGLAMLHGREEVSVAVALERLASTPNPERLHHAIFAAEWPKDAMLAPGGTVDVHVIAYAKDNAIVAPIEALEFGPKGWQVEIKLADGKSEMRPVTRGRSDGKRVEILKGLDPGQVIVLP